MDNLFYYIQLLPVSHRMDLSDLGLRRDAIGWYIQWNAYPAVCSTALDEIIYTITREKRIRIRFDTGNTHEFGVFKWDERTKMYRL